jgi:hypothetical protein
VDSAAAGATATTTAAEQVRLVVESRWSQFASECQRL